MVDTLYIERAVADLDTTRQIQSRYPNARCIAIERHGDLFNAAGQNFRAQKQSPALILARKHGARVMPTPPDYHIGGAPNFYFSHMLNCVYDCRYCFLQGMYRSANYVVFVNYDDFLDDIAAETARHSSPSWFFSGYDCDSLALEPATRFMSHCLARFEQLPNARLEIRTKSVQIRTLLKRTPLSNCVVAYSLSPENIVKREEHGTPSLQKRIDALVSLQQAGWPIGLRFDPVLLSDTVTDDYARLLAQVFEAVDVETLHSVSLGTFRLPKPFFKRMIRLYPDAGILNDELSVTEGQVHYPPERMNEVLSACEHELLRYIRPDQLFQCQSV